MADLTNRMKIIIIILFVIVNACGKEKTSDKTGANIEKKELSANEKAEKALYNDVMDVHNIIMPEMDNMMKLKSQLRKKHDIDTTADKKRASLEDAIKQLEDADESMMQWMRNFEPQNDNDNHQAVIDYYEKQKKSINKVKNEMMEAMENAREVLKEE